VQYDTPAPAAGVNRPPFSGAAWRSTAGSQPRRALEREAALPVPSASAAIGSRHSVGRRRPSDAITVLEADHRIVEDLFTRYERVGARALWTKRALVDAMITELTVHTAIEEAVLYPAARAGILDAEAEVLEALEEHHLLTWQLQELAGLDPAHERFDAKVAVLTDGVRLHVRDEEDLLFPELRTHLGHGRLVELARELRSARRNFPGRPRTRSRRSGSPVGQHVPDALTSALEWVQGRVRLRRA
jgi:hemerythrin-like domain-containing protein